MRTEVERAVRRRQKRAARQKRQHQLAMVVVLLAIHPTAVKEYRFEMRERLRKYWRLKNHVRRARMMSDGSHKRIRIERIDWLMHKQRGRCAVCGLRLNKKYVVDHILPLKLGGTNKESNVQLLCFGCNSSKWHRHPVDFMRSRGFLL